MRIECELCRQWVTIHGFEMSPDGIEIDCPACEGRFLAPAAPASAGVEIVWRPPDRTGPAASARAEDPQASAGAMTCPKCDEAQPAARACRRCGLAADRFEAFSVQDAASASPAVDAAWAACLARWGDPDLHEAFAERVVEHGAFAYAARLYRAKRREYPDDPVAESQLERVRRMAEAAAFTAAPSAREGAGRAPYRGVLWLLVVCALVAAGGGFYAILTRDAGAARPDPMQMRWSPDVPASRRGAPPGRHETRRERVDGSSRGR